MPLTQSLNSNWLKPAQNSRHKMTEDLSGEYQMRIISLNTSCTRVLIFRKSGSLFENEHYQKGDCTDHKGNPLVYFIGVVVFLDRIVGDDAVYIEIAKCSSGTRI